MYVRYVKRALDAALALMLLIVCLVPMLGIALIIKLDSKGTVLFEQTRLGLNMRRFQIYKFRTMHMDAPSEMPTYMLKESINYITRAGRFLRMSSLDELPQLYNILIGDMSFVGPRPTIVKETDLARAREAVNAYSVRPGLTGLAQVRGRDELDFEQKATLDGIYVKNICFRYDLQILLRTIYAVISADGYQEG